MDTLLSVLQTTDTVKMMALATDRLITNEFSSKSIVSNKDINGFFTANQFSIFGIFINLIIRTSINENSS